MLRTNFPGNQKKKLQGAIERLEARLKLKDEELLKTGKRFRVAGATGKETDIKAALTAYREDMKEHLAFLKTKLTGVPA